MTNAPTRADQALDLMQKKSYPFIRLECEQILSRDEGYRKVDNKRFRKRERQTYLDEQEHFDDEAWSLITGRIREQYYPDYLSPEEEIEKSNLLNEQQTITIMDKSLWREYTPRLLPVSPYMMSFRELGWASEAINELIRENKDNKKLYGKLAVISTIVVKERQRKERQKKNMFFLTEINQEK